MSAYDDEMEGKGIITPPMEISPWEKDEGVVKIGCKSQHRIRGVDPEDGFEYVVYYCMFTNEKFNQKCQQYKDCFRR